MFTSDFAPYDEFTANDLFARITNQAACYFVEAIRTNDENSRRKKEAQYLAILDILEMNSCYDLAEIHSDVREIARMYGVIGELKYNTISPWYELEEF